jgi:hypothetical protein
VDHSWERTFKFGQPRRYRLAVGQNPYNPLLKRVVVAICILDVALLVIASGHPFAWSL